MKGRFQKCLRSVKFQPQPVARPHGRPRAAALLDVESAQWCVLVLIGAGADQRRLADLAFAVDRQPLAADRGEVACVNVTAQDAVGVDVLAHAIHAEQPLRHWRIAAAAVMIVELPLCRGFAALAAAFEQYPAVVAALLHRRAE